jgi:hypothetical protein|tara:strand:+ start:352 stop:543 length:192 start_codon:yes stop_codon:yes gene_type:complete
MSIDHEVEKAINEIVLELNQDKKLSRKVLAWLNDLSEKDISASDDIEHLKGVLRSTYIEEINK